MSAKYELREAPDINQTGEKQPLYPRIVSKGTIGQEEFLDRVHLFTGISRSLLSGAMQSFQNELYDLLADGWNVELGDIGFFSVSLQGPPVMSKKEVHSQSIRFKNINFRAGSNCKQAVYQKMRLERSESSSNPAHRRSQEECLKLVEEYLSKNPVLTRANYCRLTGASKWYALLDLNKFIEQGVLKRFGGGKQVFYAKAMVGKHE